MPAVEITYTCTHSHIDRMFRAIALQRNKYLQRFQRDPQSPSLFHATPTLACSAGDVTGPVLPGLAYRNHGLPGIVAKLTDANVDLQMEALNTLIDTLKGSEMLHEAIVRLNIVNQLKGVLIQTIGDSNDRRTMLVCQTLKLIVKREIGANKILRDDQLLAALFKCIELGHDASLEAVHVMELMTIFPRMVVLMIEKDFLRKLKYLLDTACIENEHLYNLLSVLLQEAPEAGLNELYFEFMLRKLHLENAHLAVILKCFAMLINCHFGQHLCDIFVVMRVLHTILAQRDLNSNIYEFAALALQNSTHSFDSRMAAIEYSELSDILINHAQTKVNVALQIYSLQGLRQITENYNIKLIVRRRYLEKIRGISSLGGKAREIKSKLLDWLNYQVFDECGDEREAPIK